MFYRYDTCLQAEGNNDQQYDEWKPNINYTELKSADPNSRQIRITAGSDQQCGLDKIMTL